MRSTDAVGDLELAERLRSAIGSFVRAVRAESDAVPAAQLEALGLLAREGPLSTAALSRRRGVRHQSMSATVADLEERGYVTRSPDPADARGRLVSLTSDGAGALGAARAARAGTIARAVHDGLDEEERRLLAALPAVLEKLTTALLR